MKSVLHEVSKRRITALFLVLCMVFSLMPASFTSVAAMENEEEEARLKFINNEIGDSVVTYKVNDDDAVTVDKRKVDAGGAIWVGGICDGDDITITAKGDDLSAIIVYLEGDEEQSDISECEAGEDGTVIYTFSAEAGLNYEVHLQYDTEEEEEEEETEDDTATIAIDYDNDLSKAKIEVRIDSADDEWCEYVYDLDDEENEISSDEGYTTLKGIKLNSKITIRAYAKEGYSINRVNVYEDDSTSIAYGLNVSEQNINGKKAYIAEFVADTARTYRVDVEFEKEQSGGEEIGGDKPEDEPEDYPEDEEFKQYYEMFYEENPYVGEEVDLEEATFTLKGDADFTINDSCETGLGVNDGKSYSIKFDVNKNSDTVDFYFSTLFVEQYKSIKINGTEYVTGTNNMTVGGVELTKEYLLEHFYGQRNFFKITVPRTNVEGIDYVISVEKVEPLTDDYIVIGNFLWTDEECEEGDAKKDDSIFGGSMELVKAVYNNKVLFDVEDTESSIFEKNTAYDWNYGDYDENNNLIGSAVLPEGTILTVRLIPESGKQLVDFGVNGHTFTADKDNVATYTFEVAKGNFHLSARFEEVDNIVDVDEDNQIITNVDFDGFDVADSGTSRLTVEEVEVDSSLDEAIVSADITLENVFYAGSEKVYEDWTKKVTEPNSSVSISLDVADIDENGEYYIIREHEGQEDEIISDLDISGDTVTFETDKFSKFTLVGHGHECVCQEPEEEEPTCEDAGCLTYYCDICGEYMYDEEIPELGHKWNKGKITKAATLDKKGVKTYTCERCDDTKKVSIAKATVNKNQKIQDSKKVATYKILDVKKRTVEFVAPVKKSLSKITVPDTVVYLGAKFKVVKIGAKAFNNNKKLNSITIGKNVTAIGKQAFAGCSKLKTITFKGTALVAKSIDKQAFKGVSSKVAIKVLKKKVAAYDTLFKSKGLNKNTIVKK